MGNFVNGKMSWTKLWCYDTAANFQSLLFLVFYIKLYCEDDKGLVSKTPCSWFRMLLHVSYGHYHSSQKTVNRHVFYYVTPILLFLFESGQLPSTVTSRLLYLCSIHTSSAFCFIIYSRMSNVLCWITNLQQLCWLAEIFCYNTGLYLNYNSCEDSL